MAVPRREGEFRWNSPWRDILWYDNLCPFPALTFPAHFLILGIAVALFFRCIGALFCPVGRTSGGIRWLLVAHTVAMFSFVTISTAMNLDLQSICNINNREFTGSGSLSTPGPFGYQIFVYSWVISFIPDIMFLLNTWLADGLLVSSLLNLAVQESNQGHSPWSSIVAVSFMA